MAHWGGNIAPAIKGRAITLSNDSADNFALCDSIFVGTAGNIVVVEVDGTTTTYTNVPVGVFPVRAVRVNSTNTTASGLVAMYSRNR